MIPPIPRPVLDGASKLYPIITSNKYPESCFFRAPYLESVDLWRNGKREFHRPLSKFRGDIINDVPGGKLRGIPVPGAKTVSAELGSAIWKIPATARFPFYQYGEISVIVPVRFHAEGVAIGETTTLKPQDGDEVAVTLAVRQFSIFPPLSWERTLHTLWLETVAFGTAVRGLEGNDWKAKQ